MYNIFAPNWYQCYSDTFNSLFQLYEHFQENYICKNWLVSFYFISWAIIHMDSNAGRLAHLMILFFPTNNQWSYINLDLEVIWKLRNATGDPWTAQGLTVQASLSMDISIVSPTYLQILHPCVQPTADWKQAIFVFPATDSQWKIKNIVFDRIGWNCGCDGLIVFKFGGAKCYMQIFGLIQEHVGSSNPCIVQESTTLII